MKGTESMEDPGFASLNKGLNPEENKIRQCGRAGIGGISMLRPTLTTSCLSSSLEPTSFLPGSAVRLVGFAMKCNGKRLSVTQNPKP